MPQGILNSGFKFQVLKESGQAADTILFENINNMLGRILPQSFAKSVWICNPAVLPQLRAMRFVASAASPVPAYMPPSGVAEAPYGTLYGRPVLPMMGGTKALGDEGDIMLVDLSYYFAAVKSAGVKSDISTHVYFATQESAFRFSMRIAGQCPFKAPVSTENGAFNMSAFVTLEAR
jgi:HK97 family phage major capsid protein